MKKLLVFSSVAMLATMSSMAQGVINANNNGVGVPIKIQDTTGKIDGGVAVNIGTPATAAGFVGAGPGQVAMSLFAAPVGTSLQALEGSTAIWTGFNSASLSGSFQGTVGPGSGFTLPTQAGYNGSAALEFIFFGSVTVGGQTYSGYSTEGTVQPITATQVASGTPAPHIWGTADSAGGITGMTLTVVPEPSTIALGGLGAAALLLFRRRK